MDWTSLQEAMRHVGELTEDNTLVRGVITTGAAVLTVMFTAWRVLKRAKSVPRVKIDVPATVRLTVEPTDKKVD